MLDSRNCCNKSVHSMCHQQHALESLMNSKH
jgi:hypothetical protein